MIQLVCDKDIVRPSVCEMVLIGKMIWLMS